MKEGGGHIKLAFPSDNSISWIFFENHIFKVIMKVRTCVITYSAPHDIDFLKIPHCHSHTCAYEEEVIIVIWGG